MKNKWLTLLLFVLIMFVSTSVFALDVKFSGSYYAAGIYLNRVTLNDDSSDNGPSTAFYAQRLRVKTEFIVSPGLSVVTRFDALERVWGAARSTPGTTVQVNSLGTEAENQNIAFDLGYLSYSTPMGLFRAGAMLGGATGPNFGDTEYSAWRMLYLTPEFGGGFVGVAIVQKEAENSYTINNTSATQSDKDKDRYVLGLEYGAKSWNAGVYAMMWNRATERSTLTTSKKGRYYMVDPFVQAKIGPLAVEAELLYLWGKLYEYENAGAGTDLKMDGLAYYVNAVATFGPVYIGGTFAYLQGDNPDTADKLEGAGLTSGLLWNPALIMGNADFCQWIGGPTSTAVGSDTPFGSDGMSNMYFYQVKGGVKPTNKLDIYASLSYATADTTPTGYVSKNYGYEVDIVGTYKITNNLSYMLGAGYLITGDYFKGTSSSNKVANNYLVINKLTLTF